MPVPNTPLYYALTAPTYQRAMRNILSITQATEALVTTTYDGVNPGPHDYLTGLIVRLHIPDNFGMVQANQLIGEVTVVTANTFTVTIDTTAFDPFVIPARLPGNNATPAVVVPVGEVPETLINATENVLP